ncbi:MAG: chromosomal replication initiator protein DnaA [Limisphaerales bacterium]
MEDESAKTTWAEALSLLRGMASSNIYAMWFAPLAPVSLRDDTLTLTVPNEFFGVWVSENYADLVHRALLAATGRPLTARFQPATGPVAVNGAPPRPAPRPRPAPAAVPEPPEEGETTRFNPLSTFETFVVGNNNFAHAAALAVAQLPGRAYNPLFLFGGTGLGKTHLLHAIGQHVRAQHPRARIAYISCERFTNQYIEALQNGKVARFRKQFRTKDVVLIDDIQFLAGKERIQEEFFHTFNELHEARRQIVLACDRPASEIQGLQERLVSRFEWGQVADLHPPDRETRCAILRKKARDKGYQLPPEVIEFLAENIQSNVRRLEGALTRVGAFAVVHQPALTVTAVRDLLRDLLAEEGRLRLTIESIQRSVAEHYELRLGDLLGRRRPEHIVFPRQVAMYLSREILGSTLNIIGEAFGGRDHGTVLHACRQVRDRMETDAQVRKVVLHLERKLRG